jgi:hypothetical protein
MHRPTLADEVKKLAELKKAYEAKQAMLTKSFQDGINAFCNSKYGDASGYGYSIEDRYLIAHLKDAIYGAIRKNQTAVYMLESLNPRNYSEDDFLRHVTIFRGFLFRFGYILAKSQGLLVEVVDLQLVPPDIHKYDKEHSITRTDEWCLEYYKLPPTIKALKITWGE